MVLIIIYPITHVSIFQGIFWTSFNKWYLWRWLFVNRWPKSVFFEFSVFLGKLRSTTKFIKSGTVLHDLVKIYLLLLLFQNFHTFFSDRMTGSTILYIKWSSYKLINSRPFFVTDCVPDFLGNDKKLYKIYSKKCTFLK